MDVEKVLLSWEQLSPSALNGRVRSGGIDEAALAELAESIRAEGVIQPLVVCASPWGETPFEIITGERRWRAVRMLGEAAPRVPCVIRPAGSEVDRLVLMGAENLQRENLSSLEEARYYQTLLDEGLTLNQVIQRLAKTRSHINKYLKLLKLPETIQEHIERKRIPLMAARWLLRLHPQLQEKLGDRMVGQTEKKIKAAVLKIEAAQAKGSDQGGQNGSEPHPSDVVQTQQNGDGVVREPLIPKPEAQVISQLVGMLVGIIERDGEFIGRCADALSVFDAELAEEAFDWASQNRLLVRRVEARRGKN